MTSRPFLTAAVAAFACTPALAATPAAPVSPWTKVPAAPTACYFSQDNYFEQNQAALAAVREDHSATSERNGVLQQQLTELNTNDPMAMARNMQEAMLADPANAQKYLQNLMQGGQQRQAEAPARMERDQQIENERKTLMKQYEAALAVAYGPGNARWTALKKRYGLPADAPGPGESGVADWVWAEWGVILHEWDRGYAANCATWFAPTGPINAYLRRYKDFLVQERVPYQQRTVDGPILEQYGIAHISTATYRTTKDYEAVEDYLNAAYDLFSLRRPGPRCRSATDCE